ncbi:MAG: DUF4954 family protein [Pirellulales bacterium]|nr:DUF4954 family protein [Pirellulales bacterium]
MPTTKQYQPLTSGQIDALESNGCLAEDWSRVQVATDFRADRVRRVQFIGDIRLGTFNGLVPNDSGPPKLAGIYDAVLANCTIGDNGRIANIGSHIANYTIRDRVSIEGVGIMETNPGARFGNGIEVQAVNEGGGREVILLNDLSAQLAYLQCLVRWRPTMTHRLATLVKQAAESARKDTGTVGSGARISSVARIVNVEISDAANIQGASALEDGTILSCPEAATFIGPGVVAEHFILAEGATLSDGAIVRQSFVGQGCQIGKQFSAEGSLFFANCEGFHGEACSVFAGPYTVTHHKSTLLIAGLFSFYNAGSGTNQSNHMYKLGPVHEGKLERGCKTGSFSYMMWPCRVGPFSVVLGKHTRTFDTRDFPFSHIEAKSDGRCEMVPGMYLSTVGTVRDGAKWPARDRRRGPVRRDIIDFDVFSPLTVGRMLRGSEILRNLMETTDRSKQFVMIHGAEVRRVLLRTGIKYYRGGIEMYLQERLVSRIEIARRNGMNDLAKSLAIAPDAVFSEEWIDLAGQMMPQSRFDLLADRIESGEIDSIDRLQLELGRIHAAYLEDEWAWVVWAYRKHFGKEIPMMTADDVKAAAESWRDVRTKFLKLILGDANREFDELTRTGFGVNPSSNELTADFTAVRGTFEDNPFVQKIQREIEEIAQRAAAFS